MKQSSSILREHLIEFYYSRTPTAQTLAAEAARKSCRPKAVSRVRNLSAGVLQVKSMVQSLRSRLANDLEEAVFSKLRAFADGTGEPRPGDVEQVSELHEHLLALLDVLEPALATSGKAVAALAERMPASA